MAARNRPYVCAGHQWDGLLANADRPAVGVVAAFTGLIIGSTQPSKILLPFQLLGFDSMVSVLEASIFQKSQKTVVAPLLLNIFAS